MLRKLCYSSGNMCTGYEWGGLGESENFGLYWVAAEFSFLSGSMKIFQVISTP